MSEPFHRFPLAVGGDTSTTHTDEERDFLKAMDQFFVRHHRHPILSEVLEIFKSLGYVKRQQLPNETVPSTET
jgi:hypothetical protein